MKKENWVWMPHAGHFIMGSWCHFRLNTCVGKFIVSTVGELVPDSQIREIEAQSRKIILEGEGDARYYDWLKKCGYTEIGYKRKYETMVFKAEKSKDKCCPYRMCSPNSIDFDSYNDAGEAQKGHLKMCKKWSKKERKK